MPVVLDPDAVAVYKAFQEAGRPAYETLTPPEAREYYMQARLVANPEPPELLSAESLAIPSSHGRIPARIYTPKKLRKADGLAPGLVFFHGGGWVIGNLETHDVVCRKLAHEGEMIVISVDYRLAPEHRFPAAVEDAVTATKWLAANAKALGVDASRLVVGGDSAGGNLAAVSLAGRARKRAEARGPAPGLPRNRFFPKASVAQRARNLDPADAYGRHLVHEQLSRRCRHQRLARFAGARQDARRPAAGLCAYGWRRSLA